MILLAELTFIAVTKDNPLLYFLVVENRYFVVLIFSVFVVIIWVLSLKNILVLKVKHGFFVSWHVAEQLVCNVRRLNEWSHQFKDLFLYLPFTQCLVH